MAQAYDKRQKRDDFKKRQIEQAAAELVASGFEAAQARAAAEAGVAAADAVSGHKSVFAMGEFATKFSKAAGEGWLDHPKWGQMRGLIAKSVGLMALAPNQEEKDWAKWSPKSHLKAEEEMINLAKRVDERHSIPESLVMESIAKRPSMEEEQKQAAIASCLGSQAVLVTEGTAGAGKSYTLEAIKEVYERAPSVGGSPEGYQIIGTALSWTAAKVLQESAKLDSAQALQGLLIEMDKAKESGGSFFRRRTLVIVDEAGLVGTMKMRALLKHAADAPVPVRVLLTGDSLQLNPVEAGNALEAIVDEVPSARLNTIRRQERESHKAAVKHFCYGRAEQGLWTYWQQEALWLCPDADARRERVMRDYVQIAAAHPMDAFLVLALENAEVKKLNESIRERLKSVGLLAGAEHELEVNDGAGPYMARFCVGDRVVLRKNLRDQPVHESRYEKLHEGASAALAQGKKQQESGLFSKMISSLASGRGEELGAEIRKGVFNRGSGIILGMSKSPSGPRDRMVRILLAEGGEVEIDTASLRDNLAEKEKQGIAMHHNFATTIYASQGQTVQRVLMMDSPYMNRRLAYVGMSRHKISCEVYADAMDLDRRKRERASRDLGFTWSSREKARAQAILDADWFEPGELWAEMALCWNKDAQNPTVSQEIKRMRERKDRQATEGSLTGRLRQADGDDPDADGVADAKKPPSYDALINGSGGSKGAPAPKKTGFFANLLGVGQDREPEKAAPPVLNLKAESSVEMPAWASETLAAGALAELDGIVWGKNRWGEPRLFSLDKEGRKMARWTFDGECVAGRREPPVLPNAPDSPWMVVAGAREAMISWTHFHQKHKETPEKAPSIAIAYGQSDLEALSDWIPKGKPLYCAWSARDPKSLEWAKQTRARLESMGYKAGLYPKEPAPGDAERPKAKAPGV